MSLPGGYGEGRKGRGLIATGKIGNSWWADHFQASEVVAVHQFGIEHTLNIVHPSSGLSHIQTHRERVKIVVEVPVAIQTYTIEHVIQGECPPSHRPSLTISGNYMFNTRILPDIKIACSTTDSITHTQYL